jgi:predicted porin
MTRTLAALAAAVIATGARAQTPPAQPPPSDAAVAAPAAPAPAPAAEPKKEEKKPKGTFAIGPKSQILIQGRAWGEVNNVRAGKGTANNGQYHNLTRLSSNSSYLRIRGERDLDGGFKAIAQIEAEVGLDGSGGKSDASGYFGPFTSTRNTFVGLSSPYGELTLGKFDSPAKETTIGRDPFGGTGIFGYYNVFTKYRADRRLNNAIMYETPSFSGLSAMAAFSLGEGTTSNGIRVDPYTVSGAVHYKNGPLFAGLAYEYRSDCGSPDQEAIQGPACTNANLGSASQPKGRDQVLRFGTDYTIKSSFSKLAFVYDRIMLQVDSRDAAVEKKLNRDAFWASWTQGLGTNKHQIIFNYGIALNYDGTNIGNTSNTGVQTYTAAYRYNFDSDMMVYAAVTQIINGENQNYKFGSGSPADFAPAAGATATGFGAGMRYMF